MSLLLPSGADGLLEFDLSAAEWLNGFRVFDVVQTSGPQRTAPDGESLLVVASGTHDLFAGGGSWVRRGLRPTPFEGRPVALFLPPDTPFRTEQGSGHLLLVTSRQPTLAAPETASEAAGRKPLLPMAGSGKSFDPQSGSWKPKEAFLESPEALLPQLIAVPSATMGINYGCNKVRFPSPVPVDSKIRASAQIAEVEAVRGGVQVVVRVSVEVEGVEKPACIADTVSRYLFE